MHFDGLFGIINVIATRYGVFDRVLYHFAQLHVKMPESPRFGSLLARLLGTGDGVILLKIPRSGAPWYESKFLSFARTKRPHGLGTGVGVILLKVPCSGALWYESLYLSFARTK